MRPGLRNLLWAVSLLFLALWFYSALRPRVLPPDAAKFFEEDFLNRSVERARISYIVSGLSTLASFGALYLITKMSERGSILSGTAGGSPAPLRAVALGVSLGVAAALLFSLIALPFDVYRFYLDKAYNLTPIGLPAYLWDYAKNVLLGAVQYGLTGAFAAWVYLRFPRTWHFVLSGAFLVASLVVYALYPVVIAPLFNTFRPLGESETLQDVRELAASAGMEVDDVLVMDASTKTSRANAYFAGVGRTKQVVLYDTLLQSHTRGEVRLVVAHELAHWRSGHIMKGLLASSIGVLAALIVFRAAIGGALEVPAQSLLHIERFLVTLFVFATLAGFVLSPVSGYISRRFEVESDAYALALTGDHVSFTGSQVSLAKTNLADVYPPRFIRWFAASHPSTLERIQRANP